MEQRIRLGGLGGPVDSTAWETQLQQAKTIPEFVSSSTVYTSRSVSLSIAT